MDSLVLFIAEIVLSAAMSIVVLAILSTPLRNVLTDLCLTAKQADFWVAYTRIMLFMSPLMLVLMVDGMTQVQNNLIDNIQRALASALAGLILGMIIVGYRILSPSLKANNLR